MWWDASGIYVVVASVIAAGSGGGLQREAPRRSDVGELHRQPVGERDRVPRRTDCAAPLEESDARVAVQARGKADRADALVVEIRAIVWVTARRLVVISCRSRCCRSYSSSNSACRFSIHWRVGTSVRSIRGPSSRNCQYLRMGCFRRPPFRVSYRVRLVRYRLAVRGFSLCGILRRCGRGRPGVVR